MSKTIPAGSQSNNLEFAFLNQISRLVSETIAPNFVAQTALKSIKNFLGVDIVLLYLRDGNKLYLHHQELSKPELKLPDEHSLKVGQCICGVAAEKKQAMYSQSINQDGCFAWDKDKQEEISSLAALPLIHRDNMVGIICLASTKSTDFEKRSLFLETLANQIALSLSMTLLVERLNEKVKEHEIAQHQLSKSEANFRTVIENILDIFYRTDNDGHITMVSPSGAKLLGYDSTDELIGKTAASLWEQPEKRLDFLDVLKKKNWVADYEISLMHKNGTPLQVSSSSRFYYDDNGNIQGVEGIIRDIRDRKKSEEKLKKTQRLFTLIADNINEVFWVREPNSSKFEYVSPAFQNIWGTPAKELLQPDGNNKWKNSILSEDYPNVLHRFSHQLKGNKTEEKFRIKRPDGEIRWIRNKAFPVTDENGIVTLITGLAEDITVKEQTRRKNRYERLLLDGLFESIPVGITVWSEQGKLLRANKTFHKITGYSQNEIETLGNWFLRAYPDPNYRSDVIAEWQEDISQNEAIKKVYDVTCKDNSVKHIEFRVVELNDGRIIVTLDDISKRRKAELSLRESEEKYRSLVETTDTAFVIVDEFGVVLDANTKYIELSGHKSLNEIRGKKVIEWTLEKEKENTIKAIQHCFAKGLIRDFQTIFHLPDGSHTPIEINAAVMSTPDGMEIHTLCRDISERLKAEEERRKLEEQIAQAQKMEAVGKLAGGVAHDFNNMLSIILGYSEMILAENNLNDYVQEKIEEIHKVGLKSADLVNQLLAFARKQTITPIPLDLNKAIGNVLKMLTRLIGENIKLNWEPTHNIWPVLMDPAQIDQILANLVVNARDAIDGIGTIDIKTTNIHLNETFSLSHSKVLPGDYVELSISDNGCGMTQTMLEKIFEPFFTTKETGKGSGLGLSTVYGIAKQNKCLLDCNSIQGKGSTLMLYIPRHSQFTDVEKPKSKRIALPTGNETILVVEDTPEVLHLSTKMLQSLGYTVLAADTPQKALRIAKDYPNVIDLLLTDMIMPDMNGKELVVQINRIRTNLKSIFMSGYTTDILDQDDEIKYKYDFLEKPFSMRELAFKVREALVEK